MIVRNLKVDIAPEAIERIAELGLEEELDRIAEFTRSKIATLSEFRVEIYADPLEPEGSRLKITGIKDSPYVRGDAERRAWKKGVLEMASNEFLRWFRFDVCPREAL
jgi:hypothetical protein